MNIATNYNLFQKYIPTTPKFTNTDSSAVSVHSHSPAPEISNTNIDTVEISPEGLSISESKNLTQSKTRETHEITTPRLFSNHPDSADYLTRFFEIDMINANEATLSGSLKLSFESETRELTEILNGLLEEVGLDNETEEILIVEDRNGNIIIEGNIDDTKKKQLAELVNNNKELVERIKDQKAIMEMIRGLDPETNLDISSDEFMETKARVLNRFLVKEFGVSLDDITLQNMDDGNISVLIQQDNKDNKMANNQLQFVFDQIPGLKEELVHYLTNKPQNASGGNKRYLLKMKQGVLLESANNFRSDK
ncbi:MAG: hypothetical protein LBC20_09055 [Planctomycetaceae bacterium]|jgi:hypothetical protein|nr:hypothetical protein [Planctomycetaceae bacterium]